MVAILTANNRAGRDNRPPAPVLREDGSNYNWRMFFDNGRTVADADDPADFIELLSPNYTVLNEEERKTARLRLAREVQMLGRAAIISNLSKEVAGELKDWEWEVLNFGDSENFDPYGWGDGTGTLGVHDKNSDMIDMWSSSVPLVLVTTSYAPYTDIPTPVSSEGDYQEVKNIIWLRPETDVSLLQSISRTGFITFGVPRA